jgi:hypothetical protein
LYLRLGGRGGGHGGYRSVLPPESHQLILVAHIIVMFAASLWQVRRASRPGWWRPGGLGEVRGPDLLILAGGLGVLGIVALEAGPVPRHVSVGVTTANGTATVRVADTGPVIPVDALPRLFEAFFSRKERGTGLGLAIAKRTVDAHGGHITVTSMPGGRRSRWSFRWRLQPEMRAEASG